MIQQYQSADENRAPPSHINGHQNSRTDTQRRPEPQTRPSESSFLAPARLNALTRKDSSISETGSAPDSLLDLYGPNRSGINSVDYGERKPSNGGIPPEEDAEHSRWIHRDKLARIESQELQAAGIILPRARAPSKASRRENSRDQQGSGLRSEQAQKRQRVGSIPSEEEETPEHNVWDLRLPDEAAEDHGDIYEDISGGIKGVSRIPVMKTSPLPIPLQHLERETPMRRTGGGGWTGEDEAISYPKSRGRSQSTRLEDGSATPTPAKRLPSEHSPTKKSPMKKGPVAGNRAASAPQKAKGRAPSNGAAPRPPTRSGELGPSNSTNKRPEGDPPWLATMFKPDPRLPPDQQLLPTVARRLQQEQWEKEGKFGTTYDTDFRPLNDEQHSQPPVQAPPAEKETKLELPQDNPEWPLRGPKSPALSTGRPGTAGTGSYSTMPKITTGAPMGMGPIPNPPARIQDPPEEEKKSGCGCCVIM